MDNPVGPLLGVQSRFDGCCAVVTLAGELDIASAGLVEEAVKSARSTAPIEHLVFDCRELSFMDSSGIKVLLEAHHTFEGRVALLGPQKVIDRVFEVTGLDTVFNVVDSLETARELFHSNPA